MPINTEIARQTRDQILFHPSTHDQGEWFQFMNSRAEKLEECGTTACVAGHATILAGLVKYSQLTERFNDELITRWDAVPTVASGSWSGAGRIALGLEEFFHGHYAEIIIPVPDKYLPPDQVADLRCYDGDCPDCHIDMDIPGVALFHGTTSREDVLAALEWLVKEGEKQDASLDQVIEDMAKEAAEL